MWPFHAKGIMPEKEKLNIHRKLLNVQCELKTPKNQRNTFGNYDFRSAEDILEAVKPLLKKHELALTLTDGLEERGTRFYVKATAQLIDAADGNTISTTAYAREDETKKGMDGSQITGASSSYARKYALNGLFAIDDSKDSDSPTADEEKESKAKEAMAAAVKEVVDAGTALIKAGNAKKTVQAIVGKHNNGNQNPSSIKSLDVCAAVMKEFAALTPASPAPAAAADKKTAKTQKENAQ